MYIKHKPEKQAFDLFHKGSLALGEVERAGMQIDFDYLHQQVAYIDKTKEELRKKLEADKVWRIWQKKFGRSAKMGNRQQLGAVLYEEMGYIPTKQTENDENSTDKEAFADIDLPFVQDYLRMGGLHTAKSVWLNAIQREACNGFLHPSFALNIAISYRSSSSNPNVQNWPTRNPELKKIVRGCVIPRSKDYCIREDDFKGIEVVTGVCYHHDKQMLKYLRGEGDMHHDMAKDCYLIDYDWQVSEDIRYNAKNKFVFPAFYGSYYIDMGKALWQAMGQMKLRLCAFDGEDKKKPTGMLLSKHLRKKGIREPGTWDEHARPVQGTYEALIADTERHFWDVRFQGYGAWKRQWWLDYLETGGFKTKTGFAFNGIFRRNAVVNYPIQGSAFHCLLWSLTRMIHYLKKYKMKSKIIGQIHDSMLGDVHKREKKQYAELIEQVTRIELPKHWPWLNAAPLRTDAEAADLGLSWYHKKKILV